MIDKESFFEKPVVYDAVQKLDNLLSQLHAFQPLLEQCAKFTGNNIKANFDTAINMLYNRRKVLLQQLDEAIKYKSRCIESQIHSIETLRMAIMNFGSSGDEIGHHLQDCIQKAENVTFGIAQAPLISFNNNHALLEQAIAAYGQINVRYCDNVVDSSTPLDLNEDDHDQETINGQSTGLCTCADPSIRKWLLNPPLVTSDNPCRGLCGIVKNEKDSDAFRLAQSRPAYDLHMWLDRTNRPVQRCRRKLSNSFTSVDSDYSETYPLPVNWTMEDNLRGWLFSDRMDTGDATGLVPTGQQLKPNEDIEDLHKWLSPPSTEQKPQLTAGGADCFTQADVAEDIEDLHKWLSPPSTDKPQLTAGITDCFAQADVAEDLVYVGDSDTKSSEATSVSSIEVVPAKSPSWSTTTVVDTATSYDCIYSQCCGGPGGPTCCGGRPRPAPPLNSSVKLSSNSTTVPAVNSAWISSKASADGPTTPSTVGPSSQAIVRQLTMIANSSLDQWLVGGIADKHSAKDVFDEDLVDLAGSCDNSKWLLQSDAETSIGNHCAVEKSALFRHSSDRDYEAWLSTKLATCVRTT